MLSLPERTEMELQTFIERTHKEGLSYWQILRVLLIECQNLYFKADAEYYLKGGM